MKISDLFLMTIVYKRFLYFWPRSQTLSLDRTFWVWIIYFSDEQYFWHLYSKIDMISEIKRTQNLFISWFFIFEKSIWLLYLHYNVWKINISKITTFVISINLKWKRKILKARNYPIASFITMWRSTVYPKTGTFVFEIKSKTQIVDRLGSLVWSYNMKF